MKTILIIEDNNDIRENTAEILELANYKVLTATNGKVGVELALANKPDLIICDIMMPVLDGFGVLHLLNKNQETAAIPFIFLTAKTERTDLRKGMEMGADDYITKPFDDIELLNAIEGRLKKTAALRKDFEKSIDGVNDFLNTAGQIIDLKELHKNKELRSFPKKVNIYEESTRPMNIFYIGKGRVKAFRTNADGKEFITGMFTEGDFIGYLPLIEESPYADTATALEDTEVYVIPKEDFFSLLYKNAELSRTFIRLLAGNLAEKELQLLNLAYNSVRKRVADTLSKLNKNHDSSSNASFSVALTREDLANMVGTSTETAIRTLSDFKDENLIEIKGGVITVIDAGKLSRMRN